MRILLALLVLSTPAFAHDWYTGKTDPVTKRLCCGGSDCSMLRVEPGMLSGDASGYRLRMTAEQASKINPYRKNPVDTIIPWERVQDSTDGNYHVCLPSYPMDPADFFCFFAPPNS